MWSWSQRRWRGDIFWCISLMRGFKILTHFHPNIYNEEWKYEDILSRIQVTVWGYSQCICVPNLNRWKWINVNYRRCSFSSRASVAYELFMLHKKECEESEPSWHRKIIVMLEDLLIGDKPPCYRLLYVVACWFHFSCHLDPYYTARYPQFLTTQTADRFHLKSGKGKRSLPHWRFSVDVSIVRKRHVIWNNQILPYCGMSTDNTAWKIGQRPLLCFLAIFVPADEIVFRIWVKCDLGSPHVVVTNWYCTL